MTTPHVLPGDPDVVHTAARSYSATAEAVTRAAQQIRSLAGDSSTATSDAIKALAENAGDVADRLTRLHERYSTAGSALWTYGDALGSAKSSSLHNAQQYYDAQQAHDHAQGQIDHYVAVQRSASEIEQMNQAAEMVTYWVNQRNYAHQDMANYVSRHAQIESERDDAASAAQRQIDGAVDNDGLNDSTWDNIKGWVSEHAEFLKKLKDALSWITTGLSLLSLVFPVLAPFALAAAVLTAGLSLLLAASGEISWLEFGLDALSVVTMGVGAVAGRTVSTAVKGLKALRIARLVENGASKSRALRMVTGSFNSVQMGKFSLATLKSLSKLKEINTFKGMANANAMRVFTRTMAGAGPEDLPILQNGLRAIQTIRTANLVNSIVGGVDSAAGFSGTLSGVAESVGLNGVAEVLEDVHQGYEGAYKTTTLEVGSRW